ncbi:MAG: hypothetical protein ACLU9S_01750 [Oscillospiraceae bacterium]
MEVKEAMAHIHVENETGLFLTGKRIFPEKSLMLYDRPIDSHTLEDFEVASGEWEASNDGWLTGQIRRTVVASSTPARVIPAT